MDIDHMIAWLILEGWIPYPGELRGIPFPGMGKDGQWVSAVYDKVSIIDGANWGDPTTWDLMGEAEIETFYYYLQGELK